MPTLSTRRRRIVHALTGALAAAALSVAGLVRANDETAIRPITVFVVDRGQEREVMTSATTVGALLAEQQIALNPLDRSSAPLPTRLVDGQRIVLTRIRVETVTETQPIPYATKERYSTGLRVGESKVTVPGKQGIKVLRFRDTYRDDERLRREKLGEAIAETPRNEVLVKGLRGMTLASRGAFPGRRLLTMSATGYGPGENGAWGNRTATGQRVRKGVVAVDPRFIRLGTRLYIEGYGLAVAADTGSAIKGNRIDLAFDSNGQAAQFGRRTVRVMILD